MSNEENEGGFVSHLTELRKRLIHSFIFLIIFFVICYVFAEHIYGFLVDPFAQAVKDDGSDRRLIFTALQETFLTYIKVSFFTAFFVTCPFILMQIWKFIAPGLYKHEKVAILPYLILTPILFFLGGMLVYYLFNIKSKISEITNKNILTIKMILVSILVIVAFASLPILVTKGNTHFKHALEWNYFVGVITFYLLTYFFWRRTT